MQHGLALEQELDPERRLSPEGEDQIRRSGRALKKLNISFDLIISSSKKRARQTAELVAESVGYPIPKILETEKLDPAAPASEILSFLDSFEEINRTLLAGHLPSLNAVASELLGTGDSFFLHFENGGVCRIDCETPRKGSGVLRWHLTPDHLARIAETRSIP